jgi:hypothetical protein
LFEQFKSSYEDLKSVPTAAELECFFCPDSQVISNGVEVCSSYQEYLSHFVFLKDQCSSAKISPFLEKPIRAQNKVIIRYNAEIEEKRGEKSQLQIIAILTLIRYFEPVQKLILELRSRQKTRKF